MKQILLLLFGFSLLASCKKEYPNLYSGNGKKPVYLSYDSLNNIKSLPPQPTEKTGTIYLLGNYFLMLEQKRGIHVYDISDTSNPQKLSFIKIPAVNDFTINYPVIYADNGPNLVTINISDFNNVTVVNTQQNVFKPILFPPLYNGIFECGDESKGVIVDWVDVYLEKAYCSTIQ